MKKTLRILGIIAVVIVLVYFSGRYFLSGKSSFQSVYLVPADAVFIIESESVFHAWDQIVHSDAWERASHLEYLSKLNSQVKRVDSLLSNKKLVLKAISKRKVFISMHEYYSGKYDFLYVLNVGRAAGMRNPEKIISSTLGSDFRMTKRDYSGNMIYEMLDIKSGELYIFSFVKEKIILSTNYKLVEASIDEIVQKKMTLGRDLAFIDVSKRISGKGLFNLYVNYKYLPDFLNAILGKSIKSINKLEDELAYSAFSFDITQEGLISIEGYTSVIDSVSSVFTSILNAGSGPVKSAEIIPARVASLVKLSFNNAAEYYMETLNDLNRKEYENYTATLEKFEKKLKISLKDNFLSWIGNEIILLQTKPSNLGRVNEFAAIIKAKNKKDPKENLDYVEKQIKRNSPVKIRQIMYEGYSIHYISFPGLIKALFGKMLDKIEKPYYTIVNEYVIFSNHPQTLKNIIDDYKIGNTLEKSIEFNDFTRQFDKKHSVYTYLDIPVLYNNLREFVSFEKWQKLNKNKPYLTCFSKAGIQIDRTDDLLHFIVKTKYSDIIEDYSVERFDSESFLSLFSFSEQDNQPDKNEPAWYDPKIIIHDLDANHIEEFYDDGNLKFSIELKRGTKHGAYKEMYPNNSLKVKGKYKHDLQEGNWKYYDEDGSLIEEKIFKEGKEVI